MGRVSGPASGIIWEEHFNALNEWNIVSSGVPTINFDSVSGFFFLHASVSKLPNLIMSYSWTPFVDNEPSGMFDNIKATFKMRMDNGHPWYTPIAEILPGYVPFTFNTLNPVSGVEVNYAENNPADTKAILNWEHHGNETLQFGTGGIYQVNGPFGAQYRNATQNISASGLAKRGIWNDVEFIIRLNKDVTIGDGAYWSVSRLFGHGKKVLVDQVNDWTDRENKQFRVFTIGPLRAAALLFDANYIDVAEIYIRNLNAPEAKLGATSYTVPASGRLYFDASGTIGPIIDTDNEPISLNDVLFIWDYGDGSIPDIGRGLTGPYHTYTASGAFTTTLTTEYLGHQDIIQAAVTVTDIGSGNVIADADGPYFGTVGNPVVFNGSGSTVGSAGHPSGALYTWNFGDTVVASGFGLDNTTHIYSASGVYTVTLHLADGSSNNLDTTNATILPYPSGGFPHGAAVPSGSTLFRTLTPFDLQQGIDYLVRNKPADAYIYSHLGQLDENLNTLKLAGFSIYRYLNLVAISEHAGGYSSKSFENSLFRAVDTNDAWLLDASGNKVEYRFDQSPSTTRMYMIDWRLLDPVARFDLAYNMGTLHHETGPFFIDGVWPDVEERQFLSGVIAGGSIQRGSLTTDYVQNEYASGVMDLIHIITSGTHASFGNRHVALGGWWDRAAGWDLNYTSEGGKNDNLVVQVFDNADAGDKLPHFQNTIERWKAVPGSILELTTGPDHQHVRNAVDVWISGGGFLWTDNNDVLDYALRERASFDSSSMIVNVENSPLPSGLIFDLLAFNASGTVPPSGIKLSQVFFEWEWGDSTPGASGVGLAGPSHRYYTSGVYAVDVSATYGPFTASAQTSGVVTDQFIAHAGPVSSGLVNLTTTFDGHLTAGPSPLGEQTYVWDFGDGGARASGISLRNVGHIYSSSGTFDVNLTVFKTSIPAISGVASTTAYIRNQITNVNPNGPYFGPQDTNISFSGDSSHATEATLNWKWFLEDNVGAFTNQIGSARIIQSKISNPGTYNLLVVADALIDSQLFDSSSGITTVTIYESADVSAPLADDFNRDNTDTINLTGVPWVETEGNLRIIDGQIRSDS